MVGGDYDESMLASFKEAATGNEALSRVVTILCLIHQLFKPPMSSQRLTVYDFKRILQPKPSCLAEVSTFYHRRPDFKSVGEHRHKDTLFIHMPAKLPLDSGTFGWRCFLVCLLSLDNPGFP